MAKTERRPERVFGGILCSGCAKRVVEEAFYVKRGVKDLSDVDIVDRKYVVMAAKGVE